MKHSAVKEMDFTTLLAPENSLEKKLMADPEFFKGLYWGKPRYGHPEGMVGLHIREVLDNIETLSITPERREYLRLIAFVHDTFKYEESKHIPRARAKHHGRLARLYLEKIVPEHPVLNIIEWHDEAYFAWRDIHLYNNPEKGQNRLSSLLEIMANQKQMYYEFFKCDTQTGDKTQAPVQWFEKEVKGLEFFAL